MDMRMVFDLLCPGVKDGEKANPGSESFRIGSHFGKRFGHGAKQNPINDLRILQRQRSQFTRQREDDVAIRNRQNLRGPIPQPLITCPAVALWAMAVTARSVCNLLMRAMITLLHLSAKCGGAARADVSECLTLLWRQYVSPAIQELLTV